MLLSIYNLSYYVEETTETSAEKLDEQTSVIFTKHVGGFLLFMSFVIRGKVNISLIWFSPSVLLPVPACDWLLLQVSASSRLSTISQTAIVSVCSSMCFKVKPLKLYSLVNQTPFKKSGVLQPVVTSSQTTFSWFTCVFLLTTVMSCFMLARPPRKKKNQISMRFTLSVCIVRNKEELQEQEENHVFVCRASTVWHVTPSPAKPPQRTVYRVFIN